MLRVRDGGGQPRARTAIGFALVAVFCVAAGMLGSAAATAEEPGAKNARSGAGATRAYWTPERMREAIPAGLLAGNEAERSGGTIANRVRKPREAPNRTHGKVFFSDGLLNYVCSGTALRSPSKSVVWTAGHCVYGGDFATGGKFFDNWMFAPAYKNGSTPFGEWAAAGLAATRQWKQEAESCPPGGALGCGDVAHDFGAAVVGERNGKKLQQRVGGRGIVFGAVREQSYRPTGYPAEDPFDGEHMYRCKSAYQGADNGQGSPSPMRVRCDMTGGSSGGGWVTKGGDVASVVSYGYEGEPNNLYGPYQGQAARELYNNVKGG